MTDARRAPLGRLDGTNRRHARARSRRSAAARRWVVLVVAVCTAAGATATAAVAVGELRPDRLVVAANGPRWDASGPSFGPSRSREVSRGDQREGWRPPVRPGTPRPAVPVAPTTMPATSPATPTTTVPVPTTPAPATPAPPASTPPAPTTPPPPATTPPPPPPPPPPAPPAPAPAAAPDASVADQVLALVNTERSRAGCPALSRDPALDVAAQGHAEDMAAKGYFSHASQDGRSPFDRMTAAGYRYRTAGENIARGQADAPAVMTSWMNSPGHKANILNCSFAHLGVGHVAGSGGPWWVQNFGG